MTSASFSPDDEACGILAAIVESSEDAIIAADLTGVIVSWNHGAEHVYGHLSGEMLGRSVSLIIPDDRPGELAEILGRIRAGDRLDHRETVRVAKDGRRIDVSLSVSPIRDAHGLIVGASGIARDISARKRAEHAMRASEQKWRSVIGSAVDAIIVIDARGRIESFNPAAERLFGYAESEVVGQNVSVLMPSPYREEHDGYLARYLSTGNAKIIGIGREVTGRHSDGTTFPIHLSVGETSIDGDRKFTGIIHDLRPRMRIEERLREQTALARLGEMAAVIAHEVRNPLAGIRGVIQIIGGRLPKGSEDARMIGEVVNRIDVLNDLVTDLLLFARPRQPNLASADMVSLIALTVDLLREDPAFRDVQVRVEGASGTIQADAELLKIVFLNLLVNGAHAMQGHGVIRVAVETTEAECRIAFSDQGAGIPPSIRDKVFTPFFSTKSRGTGLGLPTAKQLVEAHSGTIALECPEGGGTTVTVRLPRYAR